MSRQSRAENDLAESVSTFGDDLADLSESEQKRRAEAYLRRRENCLKDEAEAYLGFDRGDVEVGRGDD